MISRLMYDKHVKDGDSKSTDLFCSKLIICFQTLGIKTNEKSSHRIMFF